MKSFGISSVASTTLLLVCSFGFSQANACGGFNSCTQILNGKAGQDVRWSASSHDEKDPNSKPTKGNVTLKVCGKVASGTPKDFTGSTGGHTGALARACKVELIVKDRGALGRDWVEGSLK